MSITKSGNRSHDDLVNSLEGTRQIAVAAAATQAAVNSAEIAFYRAALASAKANGIGIEPAPAANSSQADAGSLNHFAYLFSFVGHIMDEPFGALDAMTCGQMKLSCISDTTNFGRAVSVGHVSFLWARNEGGRAYVSGSGIRVCLDVAEASGALRANGSLEIAFDGQSGGLLDQFG